MSEKLLHIPFADAPGSTVALNTVRADQSARVVGGVFGTDAGRLGLRLPPDTYAQVGGSAPFPLTDPWKLTGWVKADAGATATYLLLRFTGVDRYQHIKFTQSLTEWTAITIEQSLGAAGMGISLSLNGVVVESGTYPTGWETPVGLLLYNDNTTSATGGVSWSDVKVETGSSGRVQVIALVSYEEIEIDAPAAAVDGLSVVYFLNSINLKSLGITISSSDGIRSRLGLKSAEANDWADQHGEVIDLTAPRFLPREITLEGYLKAASPAALIRQWEQFCEEINRPGTQRLQINVFDGKPLVYEVYVPGEVDLKKKWRKGVNFAPFSITLREPAPIKRVLGFQGPGQLSLTLSTPNALDIHWGDGTHSYDVFGSDTTITHTYAGTGMYYIVIAGLIDEITRLDHTGTLVWPKL